MMILCLSVLLVVASVAAIVTSQRLLTTHTKVLPDWKCPTAFRLLTHAQCSSGTDDPNLRSMLLQEVKEERAARGFVSMETEVGQVLLPNKYFLCALDNALSEGYGLSLAEFVASPRCKALNVHEERRPVRLPDSAIDENSSCSVIFNMITTTSRLEVSRERDDGEALLLPRILQTMQDKGSIGLFAAHWLDQYARLRTTTMEEPMHLKFNDMKDAIMHAGCWICILEHAV